MDPRRRLVMANKRLLTAIRSRQADRIVEQPVSSGGFEPLLGHDHCLVVTYRRDGRPVCQPVWPGFDGERFYVWTEHQAFKARRLRNDPRALVAPCTFRGRPLGPPIAARGRVLEPGAESEHAARVIKQSRGWKRTLFELASRPLTPVVYLEFVPAGPDGE